MPRALRSTWCRRRAGARRGEPGLLVATTTAPIEIEDRDAGFTRAEPERAALDDLDVVVGEAEQRAGTAAP